MMNVGEFDVVGRVVFDGDVGVVPCNRRGTVGGHRFEEAVGTVSLKSEDWN